MGGHGETMGPMAKRSADYFDNSVLGITSDIVVQWKYITFCLMIHVCYSLSHG